MGVSRSPVLRAESYGVRFGGRVVLRSASIWARPGTVTALFGRNGCGKTTLFRCMVGLGRAEYGATHMAGRVFQRPRLHHLARLGLVFLPDRGILPRGPVRRWLEFAVRAARSGHDADGVLAALEVGNLLDRSARSLSGGERRRVEWAIALLLRPACLVADEPLAGIEPSDRSAVGDAVRRMAMEGTAVLISGHDVADIMEIADEVVWMTGGTTHGLGAPAAARVHDQFKREYLGGR